MIYHFLYPLRDIFSPFNVFQYITFRAAGALLTALSLSFLFGPLLIEKLRAMKIGQIIRTDGPRTHLAKAGTPTMGGILILITLLLSTLLWARMDNRFILLAILSAILLGVLGFVDDYMKLVKQHSRGLSSSAKMFWLLLVSLALAGYLYLSPPNPFYAAEINVPYLKDAFVNLGSLYIPFVMLVFLGSCNAVNLTDGLDGLAIGSIIISALVYGIFAYLAGHAKFSSYLRIIPVPGAGELCIFLAAMIGAGLGFLWFNGYPAEIFMGDTGSLFLGGGIGLVALLIKQELLLVIVGGIFVLEALSVLLQVLVFRMRGKRVFRMAPLHHHFELGGLAEPKVVIRFWILSIIFALASLTALKLR